VNSNDAPGDRFPGASSRRHRLLARAQEGRLPEPALRQVAEPRGEGLADGLLQRAAAGVGAAVPQAAAALAAVAQEAGERVVDDAAVVLALQLLQDAVLLAQLEAALQQEAVGAVKPRAQGGVADPRQGAGAHTGTLRVRRKRSARRRWRRRRVRCDARARGCGPPGPWQCQQQPADQRRRQITGPRSGATGDGDLPAAVEQAQEQLRVQPRSQRQSGRPCRARGGPAAACGGAARPGTRSFMPASTSRSACSAALSSRPVTDRQVQLAVGRSGSGLPGATRAPNRRRSSSAASAATREVAAGAGVATKASWSKACRARRAQARAGRDMAAEAGPASASASRGPGRSRSPISRSRARRVRLPGAAAHPRPAPAGLAAQDLLLEAERAPCVVAAVAAAGDAGA
jgi:hypothetical protein